MAKNISNHHGYKTFLAAIESVHTRPKEIKKFLEDNRLTLHEKKLLTFFLKVRSKNFDQIPELISDNSYLAFPFLDGMRFYLLGFAFICKADSKKAEEYFVKAMPLMGEAYNDRFLVHLTFKIQVSLFYTYVNLKQMNDLDRQFEIVKQFIPRHEEDRINLKLVDLCYFVMRGFYPQAEECLDELQKLKPVMNEIQINTLLIDKFDFYVKIENFKQAELVLEEMKDHRSFRLSANYKYMDMMVRHLAHDEPLYIYEKDFAEHTDLLLMVRVIKALDEAEWDQAKSAWEELKIFSPKTFLDHFEYRGDKCLFSLSLDRSLMAKNASQKSFEFKESLYTSQELKIISLIQKASGSQLKKEELFFALNGKELMSKDELSGLVAAIYRINKKNNIQIKSKKGCYCLELALAKAV